MSSLEDEKLIQMVYDFIESSSPAYSSSASSDCKSSNHHPKYFTLQEILRSGTEAESDVLKHIRLSKRDTDKKWLVKKLQMNGFNASLCQTSWVTSSGCPGGDYEYIDILIKEGNGEETRLIVDIDFKSQFELARPTQSYKELTDLLPTIYVGDEIKLNKIISLLCSAAKQSLKDRGLHLPPWRTRTYMQCKWLRRENGEEARNGENGFGSHDWVPPMVVKKPKRRDVGGGSGLSSQFSNMGILLQFFG
ncbi:hypothetical protein HS088_TW02G00821 [Tripterygium wilfordii]|uniref:Uncharacterized protein n=1 Tax=Tripterygium wilfordii TaxID=458696 RepID=A0A7J7DZT2_TRIWF|nr:uncharacterized protein LOC120004566 [Tripterygium wilfordii]KAF5751803.1 hypothetical protein HS088_TW02G00821 [Tripterygium wilfordii]